VRGASAAGIRLKELRKTNPLIRVEHRRDGANYMRSRHRTASGGTLVAMKGAPLEVLDFCDRYLTSDGPRDMTEADRQAIAAANAGMAGAGQRVLGFACAWHDEPPETAPDGRGALIWLGLAGLADPIREGIKDVVAHFHEAGIATVMLTGDQRETAAAIARDLDLGRGAPITVVDAHDLEGRDANELGHTVERAQVFARVTPRNKLDVVRALQERGQVVAMTGDGINDSPALKAADVGVAMGRSGTPVARDVADVVLRDDNLDDMVTGIHRGRTIYRNIRKSMRFLLSTNASEILVMFAATAAGQPAPLTAMQLLWINLATDVFPAIGLALEPPDADIMRAPPRDPDEPIVRRRDLWRIGRESLVIGAGSLGGYAWGLARYGPGPQAQTVGCLGLIGGQLLHAVTCRSHRSIFARYPGWRQRNLYLDAGLAGTAGLQVLVAGVPVLRNFFGFAPLGPAGYGVAIAAGVAPFLINNILKGRETAPDWAPERTPRRSAALG
jgi:Ca2+-transporting ATPase